jgi:hypothetical protein
MTLGREEPAQDELLARYREASKLDDARPGAQVRAAVLAHARSVAAAPAQEIDAAQGRLAGATGKPGQREAGNHPNWRQQALGSLAVVGLVGLLFLQFERGTPEEREIALGGGSGPAVVPAPRPAPEAAAPAARVDAPVTSPATPPATPAVPALPSTATTAPPRAVRTVPAAKATQPAPATAPAATDSALAGTRSEAGALADAAPLAKAQAPSPEPPQLRSPEPLRSAAEPRERAPAAAAQVFGQGRLPGPTTTPAAAAEAAPPAASRRAAPAPAALGQALRHAAQRGDLAQIEALLQQGAPLEANDEAGRNALLLAVLAGQQAALARLLAAGANPQATDRDGVSALSHAQSRSMAQIEALLRQYGAR